jgi:hypothetical protein
MGRTLLLKVLLFIFCSVIVMSHDVVAMGQNFRYDRQLYRDEGRTLIAGIYREQLAELARERRELDRVRRDPLTAQERQQALVQEIAALDQRMNEMMTEVRNISPVRSQNAGTLIARGLAGSNNFDYLDGVKIDGPVDGFIQGLTVRTSEAFGKVMSRRIEGAFEDVLGGSFDFIMNYFMDLWRDTMDVFFHNSKEPFYDKTLKEWLELIKISLEDIERMMKDGLKESLRGYDMTKRKFGGNFAGLLDDKEATTPSADPDDKEKDDVLDLVWCDLISGYADQLERLCDEIDQRMGYYEDTSMEVFYAQQIKKRLQSFKNILLESKSLSDLDSKLHSNKSLIPAVRKNIENLFTRLMVMVQPRTYSRISSGESASTLFDRTGKKSASSYGLRSKDDGFPHGFSQ